MERSGRHEGGRNRRGGGRRDSGLPSSQGGRPRCDLQALWCEVRRGGETGAVSSRGLAWRVREVRAGSVVEGQDRAAHRAAETKVLVPRTESSTLRSGKTSAARNTGSQEDRSTARAADDAARTLRRDVFLWRGVCCVAFVRRGDAYMD